MTNRTVRRPLAVLALVALSAPVCAADDGFTWLHPDNPFTPPQQAGGNGAPLLLSAASDAAEKDEVASLSFTKDNENFEESWLTGSKAHQYLGLGALAL